MLSMIRNQLRTRGQRGSVLSALLIIVAFLAILGGALMNEISGQFLLTQTLANRIAAEATVNSSVESSIGQLETRAVPSRCSTDSGPGSSVPLNGVTATSTEVCKAIVPDRFSQLQPGGFSSDGTHVTSGGRNTYLVGDSAGNLFNYAFGQTGYMWKVSVGGGVSGPPNQTPDPSRPRGHFITVTPIGNAVALVDDYSSGATWRCNMRASAKVTSQPGFEIPPSGGAYFPDHVFFGDSSGSLYVYDARTNGGCGQLASRSGLGGPVVGGPLVLSGQLPNEGGNNQCGGGGGGDQDSDQFTSVDLFAIVNRSGSGRLVHYQYCEGIRNGQFVATLNPVDSRSLSLGTPVGVAYSTSTPRPGTTIRLAVTTQNGQLGLSSIQVNGGQGDLSYTTATGTVVSLGGRFSDAPYWCHCPGGDRIGAGNQNGTLYVYDTGLSLRMRFDGGTAINTTPVADSSGDWYFGSDDGLIHDVEPPASGTAMFHASQFGPNLPIQSSPVVGGQGDGCPGRVCLYFGAGSGSDFAQIGDIRVMDLNAHLTSGGNPKLWARVEVGNPAYVGGQGVHVIGWSYSSN